MSIGELAQENLLAEESEKMASGSHAKIEGMIIGVLTAFLETNDIGSVLGSSATYNFGDNLPKRQPDVSFISYEKLAEFNDEEITVAPDLAVEIVSKDDKSFEIETKVRQYQQAGVKLIWVIYPLSRTVAVYRPASGLIPEILSDKAELDGENILPGFKLPVSKLFKRVAII